MFKLGFAAIAMSTVDASKFSFGGCDGVDWEPMTDGRKYDGMNDTFIQLAEANVGLFGGEVTGWVPPCTRHEFMQVEEYPIYKWVVQTQTSWIFGLFPTFVGKRLQWVFQDYEAFGYLSNFGAAYNSQLPNGFAFKDGTDFARVYYCVNGFWNLWKNEYAYVLEWVGATNPDRVTGTAQGIASFMNLEGWTEADFAATSHEDTFGPCDYPVQILIGNESESVLDTIPGVSQILSLFGM